MDQRKTSWSCKIALACVLAGPSVSIDVLAQDAPLQPTSQAAEFPPDQLLIRLAPLDATANYPPVVTAIGCSQDGKWLAAAGDDHAVRLVQLADGKTFQTLQGHSDWVQAVAIIDEHQRIVSCSKDGTLRLWSASNPWTSKVIHQGDIALMAIAIDESKQYVACAGFGPQIWVYSLRDGTLLKTILCECSDQRALAFSSDGRQLACGGRDGVVRVWEWQTNRQSLEQSLHQDRIRSIRFSDDDSVICTVGEDRRFVRYKLQSGQLLLARKIVGGRLLSMTNIDSETIAVAGSDNTIRLIEINTGEEINRLHGHDGSVAVMVRSGGQLVSGSFDTTIRTWDLSRAMQKNTGNYEHPVSARFQDSGAGEAVR